MEGDRGERLPAFLVRRVVGEERLLLRLGQVELRVRAHVLVQGRRAGLLGTDPQERGPDRRHGATVSSGRRITTQLCFHRSAGIRSRTCSLAPGSGSHTRPRSGSTTAGRRARGSSADRRCAPIPRGPARGRGARTSARARRETSAACGRQGRRSAAPTRGGGPRDARRARARGRRGRRHARGRGASAARRTRARARARRGAPPPARRPLEVADHVHPGRLLGVEVDDLHPARAQRRHHLLLDVRLLDRPVVRRRRPDVEGAAARRELDLRQRGSRPGRGLDVHACNLRLGTAPHVA